MSEWSEQREQELRDSGWSDREITDYKAGYQKALATVKTPQAPAPPPAEARSWRAVDHYPTSSERGQWASGSFAGKLSRLLPVADDAGTLEAAKAIADAYEYTYERRPEMSVCVASVRHNSERVAQLSGTTQEVAGVLRAAGIPVVVAETYEPPQLAGSSKVSRNGVYSSAALADDAQAGRV